MMENGEGIALTHENLMAAVDSMKRAEPDLRQHGSMVLRLQVSERQQQGTVKTMMAFESETGNPVLIVRCAPQDEDRARANLEDAYLTVCAEQWRGQL